MSQQEQPVNTEQHIGGSTNVNSANQSLNSTGQLLSNGQFEPPVSSSAVDTGGPKLSEDALKKVAGEANKIKRPMNPFMIFGCEKRRKLAQVHPRMHNSEISKILGAEWKRMSEYEKAPYIQEAKRLKEQHSIEYPNYKFKANRRKPRQAVKKERPSFPYAGDINALPAAMKFPYPSPFFQESMYGSMYPAMASSHPAYSSMYSDYSSAIARQAMTAGSVARGATQTPTTTAAATADYYSLNKSGSAGAVNDYYASMSTKSEYYSQMHSGGTGAGSRTERSSTGAEVVNLPDRYQSAVDNRQFENRYSSTFNGSQPSSVATYTTMQNITHLSNDTPTAYSYSSLYEQRH